MIGESYITPKQKDSAKRLIATWRDLVLSDIREMLQMDLLSYHNPNVQETIPWVAKPVLYTDEETKYKREILLRVVAGYLLGSENMIHAKGT